MSVEVHVLASGSDGNCYVIRNDDRAVMVDAGLSLAIISTTVGKNSLEEME